MMNAELIKIVMRAELIKIVMPSEHENVNCSLQNRIRLLMFDEIVIAISSELKSGFQFNHSTKINEVLKPDQVMMHDEKTNAKL